jgi:TolB protein
LTTSEGLDDYPAWSPDGKRLAFTSNRDRNYEIYAVDSTGAIAVNLTNDPAFDHFAAWSHDGRLAFVSDRDGGFEIYVLEK